MISWDEEKPEIVWSHYQDAIFDNIESTNDNLIIEGVAGCGKTATLVEAANRAEGTSIFVAFNAHIVKELSVRLPQNVACKTLHSVGFASIRSVYTGMKVDKSKMYNILKGFTQDMEGDYAGRAKYISGAQKVISLLSANLMKPTVENVETIMSMHNVYGIGNFDRFMKLVEKAIEKNDKSKTALSFDDMLSYPILKGLVCKRYDNVFVDEIQDLNAVQVKILLKCVKNTGRIIGVGDTSQAIYGFRGADTDAIPNIIKELDATVLPLSISYRCPTSHIERAKHLVSTIEAAPGAKEGTILNIMDYEIVDHVTANDLILCRNNAPLVKPCLQLIIAGKKAIIKGKDIGNGLIGLIKATKAKTISQLERNIENWRMVEKAKMEKKRMNPDIVDDKADCIIAIMNEIKPETIQEVNEYIKELFSDNKAPITFSSIHKAKGLEANSVFILHPHLMPSKYAEQDWQIQEEQNIEYVALTRSKDTMIFAYKEET